MGFQHGLTGIFAANRSLDVIGNNVANVNTVGFKGSRAEFSDIFANNLSGAAGNQAGIGVRAVSIAQQFNQGNITTTGNPLDLSISGRGFFRMEDTDGAVSYSRAGQFRLDQYGYVVTNNALKLTGYLADSAGKINASAPQALKLDTADIPPRATGATAGMPGGGVDAGVLANVNLDARNAPIDPTDVPFDPSTPNSYHASTSISVYDSEGNPHTATMYFVKRAPTSAVVPDPNDPDVASNPITGLPSADAAAYTAGDAKNNMKSSLTVPVSNWDVNITLQDTNFAGIPGGSSFDYQDSTGAVIKGTAKNDKYFSLRASFDSSGKLVAMGDLKVGTAGASVGHDVLDWSTNAEVDGKINLPTGKAVTQLAGWDPVADPTLPTDGLVLSAQFAASKLNAEGTDAAGAPLLRTDGTTFGVNGVNGLASGGIPFNISGITQFGSVFGVNALSQDGYTSGRLASFSFDDKGVLLGRYTNGMSKTLAQLVLVNFANPQGLTPAGDNQWLETTASGNPLVGAPGTSNLGLIQSLATEDSNVELTQELVNMITAQRAYQANAQTIKTQDQLMQTVLNLR